MKALLTVILTSLLFLYPIPTLCHPTLLITTPIYLGEVFWPPSMTFLARTSPLSILSSPSTPNTLEWCTSAIDVSNSVLFSLSHPSLGTIPSLSIHDYFSEQAYITKEGRRWAECYITPEAGRMGACEGVKDWECEGGHKWTGPGWRKWSCWPIVEEEEWDEEREGLLGMGTGMGMGMGMGMADVVTGEMARMARSVDTTAGPTGSEVKEAFTPVKTGP